MGLTQQIGNWGEDLAVQYLTENGFVIMERNWRSGHYEIDIVAMKNGTLHIVEVKSRRYRGYITPEEAFTTAKFKALTEAARSYITQHETDADTQFDLIAISYGANAQPDVRYYANVAYPRW